MSITVCLAPTDTLRHSDAGGHLWVYLNWALGLRALGCRVIWLDGVDPNTPARELRAKVATLKRRLERYGLAESLAVCCWTGARLPRGGADDCLDLDAAAEADLLLNLRYGTSSEVVGRFRRSALVDIDPGLLQLWMSGGGIHVPRHDVYFTIGETVGQSGGRIPDLGLRWEYTPPCVALDLWPPRPSAADAAFTTVSHWYAGGWMEDGGEAYPNYKRTGFLPFLELPQLTNRPLELALDLRPEDDYDRLLLQERGWRVRDARAIAATPWDHQRYIQESLGEFSCAKPAYVRLETAWMSDRTPCYLASGKPAVVQYTGPSRFFPDDAGLFRFRDVGEAMRSLETAATDYARQSRLARALAEEYFDARKVAGNVLERALA